VRVELLWNILTDKIRDYPLSSSGYAICEDDLFGVKGFVLGGIFDIDFEAVIFFVPVNEFYEILVLDREF
jgi:hypothetical protein